MATTARVTASLTSSASFLIRLASSRSYAQPCQYALRSFTSTSSSGQSSKRKMQTSTAFQPYGLDTAPPPPPRNANIPDTSIASSTPQPNETRPPSQVQISEPESEAQKSKAVESSTTSPSSTATRPKTRPKLRARKAAMKLTPAAVEQMRQMLDQPEPKLIRVGVKNRGCSGLAYHLEYVEKAGAFDETVEQDGVKVLIDSKALFSIIGSEMDWVTDKLSQRFVFNNPNISTYFGTIRLQY